MLQVKIIMIKNYFLILFMVLGLIGYGQNKRIDSLKSELTKNKADKFLDYKELTLVYINKRDVANTQKF